jgi:hypothetical protein
MKGNGTDGDDVLLGGHQRVLVGSAPQLALP